MTVQPEMTTVFYRYADGNGNRYIINHRDSDNIEFEYVPVKPIESSSGEYSGELRLRKKLPPKNLNRLKKYLIRLKPMFLLILPLEQWVQGT